PREGTVMLSRIRIENFRSCKDVLLDGLGSITALIGRNGSGKTNILRAIDWMARSATSTDSDPSHFIRRLSVGTKVTADMECGGSRYRYAFGTHLEESTRKPQAAGRRLLLRESLALLNRKEQSETLLTRNGEVVDLPGRPEPIRIGWGAPCLP